MSQPPGSSPTPSTELDQIPAAVQRLRRTFGSGVTRPLEWRRTQLQRLAALAKELVDTRRESWFTSSRLKEPAAAEATVHLATTSDDPEIITAALRGMSRTHTTVTGAARLKHAPDKKEVDAAMRQGLEELSRDGDEEQTG